MSEPSRGVSELTVLTGAKTVSNVALRWISAFLPTLERAFGTTTGTLTTVMGAAELGGLSTIGTGRWLDRGLERRVFEAGLVAVAVSSLVALGGTTWTFAIAFAILILGVGNLTVAGHAWIGHRVAFQGRGRAFGIYETSWALALLLGAPVIALLIRWFGWRGPFVAICCAAVAAVLTVRRHVAPGERRTVAGASGSVPLPASAYLPMLACAATAAAGLGAFVVSGAWMDDRYGMSTTALGVIAAASGAVELASSSAVAAFSDRVGARRSVFAGLAVLLVGAGMMALAGASAVAAIAGLLVFLLGFEYAFVSSLTLVSEAAPLSRGKAIGLNNAVGTIARSGSVVLSGQLYERSGMRGSLVWVVSAALMAGGLTWLSRRSSETR